MNKALKGRSGRLHRLGGAQIATAASLRRVGGASTRAPWQRRIRPGVSLTTSPAWTINHGDGENLNRFLCLIEPSTLFIRSWLRKIDVRETVEALAAALDRILTGDPDIRLVRWWQAGGQPG